MLPHRFALPLLAACGLAACDGSSVNNVSYGNGGHSGAAWNAISVAPSQASYINGGVVLNITNNSADATLYVDRCFAELQQHAANGWQMQVGYTCSKDPVVNLQPPIELPPGAAWSNRSFFSAGLSAGQYRAVFRVRRHANDLLADTSYSSPFTVMREAVPSDATSIDSTQVRTVLALWHSAIRDERFKVIQDKDAWAAFWTEAYSNYQPAPPLPFVDFTQKTVLVATMGVQPSGGYTIQIQKLYRLGSAWYVLVDETAPGSSCAVTLALTAPLHVVEVPKISGDVHFVARHIINNCS